VFDEGHLELLRVLASEASNRIRNARLFQRSEPRRDIFRCSIRFHGMPLPR